MVSTNAFPLLCLLLAGFLCLASVSGGYPLLLICSFYDARGVVGSQADAENTSLQQVLAARLLHRLPRLGALVYARLSFKMPILWVCSLRHLHSSVPLYGLHGVDYPSQHTNLWAAGNDISNGPEATASDCCNACKQSLTKWQANQSDPSNAVPTTTTNACLAWTFSEKQCYLKNGMTFSRNSSQHCHLMPL